VNDIPIAVLGNISIDDLVFDDGTTMWCVPGGNAVYAALGIAVWQERASIIAPVGPEYPVNAVGDRIDLSRCRPIDRTLRDWGLYEEDGTRTFVFRSRTRNWLEFSPTLDDVVGLRIRHAHLAPLRWDLQLALAGALRAAGTALVSIDIDDRYVAEVAPEKMAALYAAADLFLPSRQDVQAMLPGRSMVEALKVLRERAPSVPVIAIKLGAEGVIAHAAGESSYFIVPSAAASVVDVTGAGDAFAGGALAGYASTGSAVEAVLRGSVSASFAVAGMGPTSLVDADRSEAEARLGRLRERVETQPL
jgi:sugar/nucleoside kinase (ribokinase family)